MGRPQDFLGEGPLTILGNMLGQIEIALPEFDTAKEWEEWFDMICEKHVLQTGKYGWEIVQDKDQFLKDMGYIDDEENDDPDAETPFEQYFFEMG